MLVLLTLLLEAPEKHMLYNAKQLLHTVGFEGGFNPHCA
jgi:hypothetical protein